MVERLLAVLSLAGPLLVVAVVWAGIGLAGGCFRKPVGSPVERVNLDKMAESALGRVLRGDWASPGSRFALARPLFAGRAPMTGAAPQSASAPRRGVFGLRFFRAAGQLPAGPVVAWRYCPVRQVAVHADTSEPLVHTVEAWERTTSGGADGKRPGVEEWHLDYCGDTTDADACVAGSPPAGAAR